MGSLLKKTINTTPYKLSLMLLLLRLLFGGLMLLHGIGKLQDLINGNTAFFDSFDPFGIGGTAMLIVAVVAEFFCAILLILGLFTRLALIPLIVTMAVAFFIFHADDEILRKESALIYMVSYIILFFTGAGRYSLDAILTKRIWKGL